MIRMPMVTGSRLLPRVLPVSILRIIPRYSIRRVLIFFLIWSIHGPLRIDKRHRNRVCISMMIELNVAIVLIVSTFLA